MSDLRELLELTASRAADFLETLDHRPVFPQTTPEELRRLLAGPLPEGPTDPAAVVEQLAVGADPGIVAMPSGRYFGFVIGGSVPAALAADWLTSAWDQNAGLYAGGPSASIVEDTAGAWLKELLGIPSHASFGFVTGCQMAHVTALAAARFHVLQEAGWNVNRDGLSGSPRVRVLAGAKRHITIDRALRLLGLGTPELIAADSQGRMHVEALQDALAAANGPTIVCAQAGEVNTGAFDSFPKISDAAEAAGAWLHVDGAFGLWAATVPSRAHLLAGAERADSWATDGHKWLNVPYDSGIAFCAHPEAHRAAMTVHAEYLVQDDEGAVRDPVDWTPEFSRRARGFTAYAAVRSLGRSGIAALVERCCAGAERFAREIQALPGVEVLNDVVLNQVLFRFEDDARTDEVLRTVQESGAVWMSGTVWDGRRAIRLSVSNWQTGDAEIDLAGATFREAVYAGQVGAR